MDCGFCDRLFGPDAAGQYEGITRIWAYSIPGILTRGYLCKRYATCAGPNYRKTGHRLGLRRENGLERRSESSTQPQSPPARPVRITRT
jgi:hypothetical protein